MIKSLLCYNRQRLTLLLTVLSGLFAFTVEAQYEPLFTQYMFNEMFINPAYVGSHENISTTLLYRKQWVGINGAPETQTLSIHSPVDNRRIGLGLAVMNENIGVSHQFSAYGYFAYRILYPHSALSFGLSGGFVNDEELYSQLQTITPGDHQFQNNVRKMFMPNAGFGIYYYEERFYAGLSIPRLLENTIMPSATGYVVNNFGNPEVWHYFLTGGYVFDLGDELKFKPDVMIKAVAHAPVELDVNISFLLENLLWLGAGYRTGDAFTGMFGFQLSKDLRIGYSYDYTLTDLQKYNSGTHEFTLRYDLNYHKNFVNSSRYF